MRIGIIACDVLRLELNKILKQMGWSPERIFLDSALHINPQQMRETLINQINLMGEEVDAVFLGYGTCQSLEGIEEDCKVPVILPRVDDCISLLLSPERYAEEIKKEAGTWFMTPGWTKVGTDMVIRALRLDRVVKYGKDPMEMAKRLFTHYRRGLLIDTGVGEDGPVLANAEQFCKDFGLTLEKTDSDCAVLKEWVSKARQFSLGRMP